MKLLIEKYNQKSNHFAFLIITSTLLFILSYSYIGLPIRPSLDPSYQFAFNYFFANNILIGKDILFSFGPLGFLLWPEPIGNNLIIAYISHALLLFLFIFLALYLNSLTKRKTTAFSFFTIFFITLLIALQINIHNLVILIPAMLLILHKLKANIFYLILANIIIAFALMIKASAGIIALSILFSYCFISYFESKKLTTFFISNGVIVVTFLLIWFSLYQDFSAISDYFIATLELSRGNSSAMSLSPENNGWLLTLFLCSYILFPIYLKDKNVIFLYLLMFLATIIFFKYAFSRADAEHIAHFLIFLAQFLYLLLLVSKEITKRQLIGSSVIFSLCVLFTLAQTNLGAVKYFLLPIVHNISNKPIISPEASHKKLLQASEQKLQTLKLKQEALDIIQNKTVDIYPWEASYIAANTLNWHPRPIFQSYISYTPYLDAKNAQFYQSKARSHFILWIKKQSWGGELNSIDGRYLLNDEPLTLLQILNNYTPIYEDSDILLLKQTQNKGLEATIIQPEKAYSWNTWIAVPDITSTNLIQRAKIQIERSVLQKIKKLLYKESAVYITYKFSQGVEKKYRIVVDNAQNGLWLNPWQNSLLNNETDNKVIAIKLTHSKNDYFKDNISIQWELITPVQQ